MIALFGGTFNPIHKGHISLALEVSKAFELDAVEFLPSYLPVHRELPAASADMRRKLVEIAIRDYPELKVNSRELDRQGPSYAVDTLKSIRQDFTQQSICWLMGVDSFNSFLSWKDPGDILQLANLIVCARPDVELDKTIFVEHYLQQNENLKQFKAGKIVFYPMQPGNCSSTKIRKLLKQGQSAAECLTQPVLEFIKQHKLY